MLAIYRQKLRFVAFHVVHKQTTAGHQRFFIRQQNAFTRTNCRQRRQQTRCADNRRHDLINIIQRSHITGSLLPAHHLGTATLCQKSSFYLCRAFFIIHYRIARRKLQALLYHTGNIFTRHQRSNTKFFRVMAYYIQRTATNGTG